MSLEPGGTTEICGLRSPGKGASPGRRGSTYGLLRVSPADRGLSGDLRSAGGAGPGRLRFQTRSASLGLGGPEKDPRPAAGVASLFLPLHFWSRPSSVPPGGGECGTDFQRLRGGWWEESTVFPLVLTFVEPASETQAPILGNAF